MKNSLLIIDISHDSITFSEFDMQTCRPEYTENYSLMDHRGTEEILAGHFLRHRHHTPVECCIICDAITTDKWLIPVHNPQMCLNIVGLKAEAGINRVSVLSSSTALSFSALLLHEDELIHLTGKDILSSAAPKFILKLDNVMSCSLLSYENDNWTNHGLSRNYQVQTDEPFLQEFISQYGAHMLLSERGLALIYNYVLIQRGKGAESVFFGDILQGGRDAIQEEARVASDIYFKLMGQYFDCLHDCSRSNHENLVFLVQTTQPAAFRERFWQTLSGQCLHSVYLMRNPLSRLYGAVAWVRQCRSTQ